MKKEMKYQSLTLLALLALTLAGCDGANNQYIRVVNSYDIYTDTIRGHVYLHVNSGGILHDPDCPCHNAKQDIISND